MASRVSGAKDEAILGKHEMCVESETANRNCEVVWLMYLITSFWSSKTPRRICSLSLVNPNSS